MEGMYPEKPSWVREVIVQNRPFLVSKISSYCLIKMTLLICLYDDYDTLIEGSTFLAGRS